MGRDTGVAAQMRNRCYWPVTPVLPTKPMGVLRGPRDDRRDHIMTTTPPNFGDVPSPERDLEAQYDHARAAREFLDAADRINSQANAGSIPF